MSAVAGIAMDVKLSEEFKKMKLTMGDYKGWLQVFIDFDKHSLCLKGTGNIDDANFESLAANAKDNEHCYFIMKEPLKQQKFILVHWAPDKAPVKQRFLYSSYVQKCKDQLESSSFGDNYFISEPQELTIEAYKKKVVEGPKSDVRTWEEIEQEKTDLETVPTSTKSSVMASLPIKVSESFTSCLKEFCGEEVNSILMDLNKDQSVNAKAGPDGLENVRSQFDSKTPAFALVRYKHDNREGESATVVIFIYFCAEDCTDRRMKFTYSTCKANVVAACKQSVDIAKSFEAVEVADLTPEKLLEGLYPVYPEKKEIIKAKAPKKRKGKSRRNLASLKN